MSHERVSKKMFQFKLKQKNREMGQGACWIALRRNALLFLNTRERTDLFALRRHIPISLLSIHHFSFLHSTFNVSAPEAHPPLAEALNPPGATAFNIQHFFSLLESELQFNRRAVEFEMFANALL
jgi:hypothetical protein